MKNDKNRINSIIFQLIFCTKKKAVHCQFGGESKSSNQYVSEYYKIQSLTHFMQIPPISDQHKPQQLCL